MKGPQRKSHCKTPGKWHFHTNPWTWTHSVTHTRMCFGNQSINKTSQADQWSGTQAKPALQLPYSVLGQCCSYSWESSCNTSISFSRKKPSLFIQPLDGFSNGISFITEVFRVLLMSETVAGQHVLVSVQTIQFLLTALSFTATVLFKSPLYILLFSGQDTSFSNIYACFVSHSSL